MGGSIAALLASPFVRQLAVLLLSTGLDYAKRSLTKKEGVNMDKLARKQARRERKQAKRAAKYIRERW